MRLGAELKRLGRHSAIYGLGGFVSRILATLLLPLYTHYLPPNAYGRVEIVTATTAVLAIVLQMGIASAFFRFYFDAKERAQKLTVIRTSFWFTMAMSTLGLAFGVIFAGPGRPLDRPRPRSRTSSAPAPSASGPRPTTSS